jgi:branched-chain amino acid transport system permease protein
VKRGVLAGALLAFLIGVAFMADNYLLRLATTVFMYAVLALSWNFIGGFAGYPSFATAAFFGLGAYAAGVLQHAGVAMPLAWLAAGAITLTFAAGLGAAILHLRGHYFAIASLVVADVLREIINSATAITGGGMGMNIAVFTIDMTLFTRVFYFAMLSVVIVTVIAGLLVARSKLGFGLRCIEQNEDAAAILGVDTVRSKVIAFALSGVFVGVAGAIYGSWVSYIDPHDAFDVLISVKPIIMTLLGGPGTIWGPIVGAAIFLAFEEAVWRNFLMLHEGLLGVIVVLLVLFLPKGLAGARARLPVLARRRAAALLAQKALGQKPS